MSECQAIFDHSGIAVVCTRERRVYHCNPRASELFGWPEDTLLGQSDAVFHTDGDARNAIGRAVRQRLRAGQVADLEVPLARRDGNTFVAHLIARAVDPAFPRQGIVWIVRDITREVLAREHNKQLLLEQQLIFENARAGILILRDRVIQRCNRRLGEIFGYAPEEMIGKPMRLFYTSDDEWREVGHRTYAAIAERGIFRGDATYRRRDGRTIRCGITGGMVNPADANDGYVFLYEDITAHRAAEEALAKSAAEQQLIFDNAMIGISYQRDSLIVRCNRRCEEIFGYPHGVLVGQSTRILFSSQQAWENAEHLIQQGGATDGTFDGEFSYCRRDGSPIRVHVIGRTIDHASEGQNRIWTYEDVTAQRAAEHALRQSHQQLEQRVAERTLELSEQLQFMRQLVEAIPGPVYYKDPQGRYLGCNQAFLDLVGKSRGEVIGASVFDLSPIEVANRQHALDRELLDHSGSQVYESKVWHADGSARDFVIHKATYGPLGRQDGLVGVMLDITERKRMEERLRLAATVFDSSAEGIVITAPDGRTIAVNRAFTDITGYGEQDALGRNPRFLKSRRTDDSLFREMWQTLAENGRWRGELWNRRKDGRDFLESLTISAVKNENGSVTHYVGVFSDITELHFAHEQLKHQAHHDPLTGLPNRLLLVDRLHKALQYANREGKGLAVLFIDLDRFKNINDTLGHKAGDQVLCEVSTRMKRLLRESDTVGRLGGDEFVIIVADIVEPTTAALIADKILKALRRSPVTTNPEFFVGASIGISVFPQDGDSGEVLMKNADTAMYRAKEEGRDAYEFFTSGLTQSSLARQQMEADLRRALEREEFRVHLQAQFSLHTGAVIGAEAILLWQHPSRGLLPPAQFVKVAEDSELIIPLGEWLLRRVGDQWATWLAAGYTPGIVSINISGLAFARGSIRDTLNGLLQTASPPITFLNLEVSENTLMGDAGNSAQVLRDLRAMGLGVIINDFGTGYSSLAQLTRLPLDRIKLDSNLIQGNPAGASENSAVVHAIVALGHSLRLPVLADGIDSAEQRDFVTQAGCDQIQGDFCAPALSFDAYEQRFLRN